jgi:uncharacterized GH25 family protein
VDRAAGLPLEIIAQADVNALAAGDDLPIRLLFKGKPLRGALVRGMHRDDCRLIANG